MKKIVLSSILATLITSTAYASDIERDATINVFAVGAKTDKNQDSSAGMGLMYDSEEIKVRLEGTSDFFKIGGVYKFNPYDGKWYVKVGGNYINQKMYSAADTSTRVNQGSLSLASGYMLQDDLYIEVGASHTRLSGEVFGDYEIDDEKTSATYLEVAKRWETDFGTLDTTLNAGEVFYEYKSDEFSYGFGIDYYPTTNSKIGYNYQNEEGNIANVYSAQYSYVFVEFADNISNDTYQVNAGIKIAFDNLFDTSTWKAPTNIKPHLSELHKFESMTFATNMSIQSNEGVKKTQEAIDRDAEEVTTPAISTPTITMADTSFGDGGGGARSPFSPTVTGVNASAIYSLVSDPTDGKLTIDSATGVMTWDGDVGENKVYTITVKVTNTDGSTGSDTFTLTIFNTL